MIKNLSALRETQVQSLSQEDLPERGMPTRSSLLSWRIPWTEEPVYGLSLIFSCMCIYVCVYIHTHTHTIEYYSVIKRNEIGSFVVMWMNLGSVIHSEARKTHCLLMYIYGI